MSFALSGFNVLVFAKVLVFCLIAMNLYDCFMCFFYNYFVLLLVLYYLRVVV